MTGRQRFQPTRLASTYAHFSCVHALVTNNPYLETIRAKRSLVITPKKNAPCPLVLIQPSKCLVVFGDSNILVKYVSRNCDTKRTRPDRPRWRAMDLITRARILLSGIAESTCAHKTKSARKLLLSNSAGVNTAACVHLLLAKALTVVRDCPRGCRRLSCTSESTKTNLLQQFARFEEYLSFPQP